MTNTVTDGDMEETREIDTPDSTTNCASMDDIEEKKGKVMGSTSPTRVDTVLKDGTVSSLYSDLTLDVGGEVITLRRFGRTYKITSLLKNLDTGRYACYVCGEES